MTEANQEVEAVETQNENGADEVVLHSSITDMLSHDSEAAALGGNDLDDVQVEIEAGAEKPEETGEIEGAEPPPAEKEVEVIDWEAKAKAFQAKAEDEVRKRQALENQTANKPVEKADLFEDPDTRLAQETDPIKIEFQNRFLLLAESQARARHGEAEYNEAQEAFLAAAATNPGLVNQALNAADPGEFQFQEGKKQLISRELGDGGLDSIREKIRAEERAGIQAEINKQVSAKLAEIGKLPPGSVDLSGKNNRQKPIDTDLSLTDILGR